VAPETGTSGCAQAAQTEIVAFSSDTSFLERLTSLLANAPDFRLVCAATPQMLPSDPPARLWLLDRRTLNPPAGTASLTPLTPRPPTIRAVLLCHEMRACADCFDIVLAGRINGCLSIGADAAQFLRALRAIRAGELWLPRRVLERAFAAATGGANGGGHHPPLSALTPQEARVAAMAAGGLMNKEIAQHLHISSETVKRHLRNVFAKLGLHRRAQLASRFKQFGA
jgi:DNA-binding NarL/FixJ family response regulator